MHTHACTASCVFFLRRQDPSEVRQKELVLLRFWIGHGLQRGDGADLPSADDLKSPPSMYCLLPSSPSCSGRVSSTPVTKWWRASHPIGIPRQADIRNEDSLLSVPFSSLPCGHEELYLPFSLHPTSSARPLLSQQYMVTVLFQTTTSE